MLQAIGSSSTTLSNLSQHAGLHTRDCYAISRSVIEMIINICYIMAVGSTAAEKALRHAKQKSYRDGVRESTIGESIIQVTRLGLPKSSEIDGMEELLVEFTSRANREKGWVDLSLDERIEVIGKKLGHKVLANLHFARFAVYRHASEILHGTFYSALYFLGHTETRIDTAKRQVAHDLIGQKHMMILFATVVALSCVVETFHLSFGFEKAYQSSQALIDSLKEIPYLSQKPISPSSQ